MTPSERYTPWLPISQVPVWCADEEVHGAALGRRSGCGQLAGSNFVLDRLVEGETVAEVLQNAHHQVPTPPRTEPKEGISPGDGPLQALEAPIVRKVLNVAKLSMSRSIPNHRVKS